MKTQTFKIKFIFVLLSFSASAYANICLSIDLPESENYEYKSQIRIPSFDGTILAGHLIRPRTREPQALPTIIFVNSWSMEEHEYLKQALEFVSEGFQVFSYSARGWGCSKGLIDVVGENDMKDVSAVIDWMILNTNIDSDNIGISGISYGAGLALMSLAKDTRIKTAVAMSGWGSLLDSLYGYNTPRAFWSSLLLITGYLTGNMDSQVLNLFSNLVQHKKIAEVKAWANSRSPSEYLDLINQKNSPVYISNNFGDNLFQPNQIVEFYNKLTVPKQLDLNQGSHATGELPGLISANNHTFKRAHAWFKFWLQDISSPDFEIDQITVGTNKNNSYISLPPATLSAPQYKTLFLHPASGFKKGQLSRSQQNTRNNPIKIISGRDTWAKSGIPMLSAILSGQLGLPFFSFEPMLISPYGVDFISEPLSNKLTLFGAPKLTLQIGVNQKNSLIVAYLYDLGPNHLAKLITHGAYTKLQSEKSKIDFELITNYYEIKKNHRLVLSLDTKDILYSAPISPTVITFSLTAENQSYLQLPELPPVKMAITPSAP